MTADVLNTLYNDISREEFRVSWEHPEYGSIFPAKPDEEFFVGELPVKNIAPFDLAYARIYLRDGGIACCLTFVFREKFKDCTGKDDCLKSIEKYELEWHHVFHEHFGLIADYFALGWELESIMPESDDEACGLIYRLEGWYDLQVYTRIRTLLLEIIMQ